MAKFVPVQKLKAIADHKMNMTEKLIVGKGENTGYHHFLLFLTCFQKASFFKVDKTFHSVFKPFKH